MPFAGFFSNNPIVAWGLVILVGLGLYKGKEELDEARGARQQQRKMEAKARKTQRVIEKRNEEILVKADTARDDAPRGVRTVGELRDDARRVIISE